MLNRRSFGLWTGMAAAVALTAGAIISSTASAATGAAVGSTAPSFEVIDSNGNTHTLSDFEGKRVILEWTNHGCPFVKKHYAEPVKNIQNLQLDTTTGDDEVIWLSVISSAPGKQGYVSGDEANALTETRGASPTAVILDPNGELGKLYGAKTTPHMFIIDSDAEQTLVYAGAIDDNPSANVASIDGARNYVTDALSALSSGKEVEVASTAPYGCSVKY